MSKKKKMDDELKIIKVKMIDEKFEQRNMAEFCKEIMTIYGGNVNIARAVPDIKDGLI